MNAILKKRFREIIRKHYEDNYTRSFERTKDMYVTIALVDQILDQITVDDLIPVERLSQIKMLDDIIGNIYDQQHRHDRQFDVVDPNNGELIKVTITFR